jgi:hypothetical protein
MAEKSPRTRLRRALRRLPRWSVPAGVAVLCAVAVPCGGYLDVTGPMDTVRVEEGGALARGHSRLAAGHPVADGPCGFSCYACGCSSRCRALIALIRSSLRSSSAP